ncbi:peptidase domain-containing ABC transporter [Mucilaginibacter lacusdianchii]|uniref:peptidase domain-containing ABC transporter n=1 Tax=Mucilaginibacter lacusdianchii TaxID=2684211 RepID=UPI00131B092A|nr:peptidase domain-containing ABC transporter [Mucilaginibacter sp. JXJ CY 39]
MRFKYFSQLESVDCGPACLKMIAHHYGKNYDLRELKEYCDVTRLGITLKDIIAGSEKIGLETAAVRLTIDELASAPLPAILYWRQEHYVVIYSISTKKGKKCFCVADPAFGKVRLSEDEFIRQWKGSENKGTALLLEPGERFFSDESISASKRRYWPNLFQYIGNAVKSYKYSYLFVLLLFAVAMVTNWVTPVIFQKIIDKGILPKNLSMVWYFLMAQFVLFIGNIVSDYSSSILLMNVNFRIGIKVLSEFLQKLIRLPIGFFDVRMNTDLIQRIDDQERIQQFLTYRLIAFIFAIFNLAAFSIIVLFYNLTVFSAFLLATGASVTWTLLFLRKRKILDYSRFSVLSENKNNIYELIIGMPEIKVNNAQQVKLDTWENTQSKLNKIVLKALHLNYYQLFGVNFFNKIKDICVTGVCAYYVIHQQMTLGEMMAISYILGQLKGPTDQIIEFSRTSQEAKMAYDRIDEIHQKPDEQVNEKLKMGLQDIDTIRLEGVSFKYAGSFNPLVLQDVQLTIPGKKITAIVGSSGSGKTTLMKLLLGFYPKKTGDILLNEIPLEEFDINYWRDKCGVVMQDGFIYSGTVAENIALADNSPDLLKLQQAAQIACLADFIESLPMGFNTKVGRSGLELSGGQKQRLLIARAVYKNPEFMLFDEATSSLDANNERQIMANLNQFFKGRTVVVIAHRLSTVMNADQIIVLEKGVIIEQGSHHELVKQQSFYYDLVKNQLELGI